MFFNFCCKRVETSKTFALYLWFCGLISSSTQDGVICVAKTSFTYTFPLFLFLKRRRILHSDLNLQNFLYTQTKIILDIKICNFSINVRFCELNERFLNLILPNLILNVFGRFEGIEKYFNIKTVQLAFNRSSFCIDLL